MDPNPDLADTASILIKATVVEPDWTYVDRVLGADFKTRTRYFPEALAIRAAEYNLDPDDDLVMDMVLLEQFIPAVSEPYHPLYAAGTIKDALATVKERIEGVRVLRGSPKGKNRMLAAAVRNEAASEGLVTAAAVLLEKADGDVAEPVKFFRDRRRADIRQRYARDINRGQSQSTRPRFTDVIAGRMARTIDLDVTKDRPAVPDSLRYPIPKPAEEIS